MPLSREIQREEDAALAFDAEHSYIDAPTWEEIKHKPCDPDPDEPHESESPSEEELKRRENA